jgi:hypothetical protein
MKHQTKSSETLVMFRLTPIIRTKEQVTLRGNGSGIVVIDLGEVSRENQ